VQDIYYDSPDDVMLDGPSDVGPCIPPDVARTKRHIARDNREAHSEETEMGLLMHGVMGLWMRSAGQGRESDQRIGTGVDSQADFVHSCDKVNMWMNLQGE